MTVANGNVKDKSRIADVRDDVIKRLPEDPPRTGTRKIVIDNPIVDDMGLVVFQLESTAALLMQQFSEKSRDKIIADQSGEGATGKRPRNWTQEFLDSLYIIGARPKTAAAVQKAKIGIPAAAFKDVMTLAGSLSGEWKTEIRSSVFPETPDDPHNFLVRITPQAEVVQDIRTVRQKGKSGGKVAVPRCRALIPRWVAEVRVGYLARLVSGRQVANWMKLGGVAVGLCEYRPRGRESSGNLGTFKLTRCEIYEPTYGEVAAVAETRA